ncbi:glycine/betaine ABC transporter permease [Campylobacter pinnipediorum subsp. pinnipediorum]|uniref:ABC transporter permease/substrate-binding protein n=1 Tax=Campylobacter pinnipediorum TaxID=1965231 RepID=UPI0009957BE3|nr:ABC transporter permease/substrate-binding protein [Campylobacter pinnipediorum]OPA77098.1 glycine/betaine ABC transporter permease [Campylobacter pinnipediorum subsp. pinnipediorum]
MNDLIITFNERKFELFEAVLEHLQISLSSLLIAIAIAVPMAILISNNKKITEIVLQVTGIFQTIPSLALLGLFIPLFGIGAVPAVIALVIYSLFPIVQNTITGLNEINPSLKEAAEAFGMTKWEKLKKFELAIAIPVIISGIQTATVMIIGTATLAALIGAGGLGRFVLLGIDRNNTSLILIGAISSALLAILFSVGIRFLRKQNIKLVAFALFTMVLSLGLSFLPTMENQNNKIIIAGKLGVEPEILINIYKEIITNNSDIKVELKPNFGKTSFLYEALKSGDIDMYPEFSGTVVKSLLKKQPLTLSNDPQEVYEIARDGIKTQDDLAFLKPMEFQNTYAVAVKSGLVKEYGLKNISDLRRVSDKFVAGFTLEFNDRKDGNLGLKTEYGLNLKVKTVEPALRYKAIENNEVQIIDAYSTDSELRQYDLVVLNDDKHIFPPYQGAPLIKENTLKKYPKLKSMLEVLAGHISTKDMSDMNYAVRAKGRLAKDVAREYLIKNNLIDK